MKFCPRCGAEAADAQKFCTRCGQPYGPLSGAIGTPPVTENVAQPVAPPVVDPVPGTDRGSGVAASDPGGMRPRISRRPLVAAGVVLALLVTGVTIALSDNGKSPPSCSDAIRASDAASAKVANDEGPIVTSCASLADFMSAYDLHPQDHTYSPSAVLIFCDSSQVGTTPSADFVSKLCTDVRATPADKNGRFGVGPVATTNAPQPTATTSYSAPTSPTPLSTVLSQPSVPDTTITLPPVTVTLEIIAPRPAQNGNVSVVEGGSTVIDLGKSIPMRRSITVDPLKSLDFHASGFAPTTEPGNVTCRITFNGKVLAEETSAPQGGGVECAASSGE